MKNSIQKQLKEIHMEISTRLKSLITIGTVLGMAVGAVIAAEDRYVNELEAAETMQQVQQSMQQIRIDMHKENQMLQYDFVTRQYFDTKARLSQDPNNPMLKYEMDRLEIRRNSLGRDLGIR